MADVDVRRQRRMAAAPPNHGQYSTHPHAYEQLLVGWLMGGTTGESRG
jgi:hypothetical protein